MSYKKILVIYKKSTLQLATERKNKKILDLVAAGDPSVSGYQPSHDAHTETLSTLKEEFKKWDFKKVHFRHRANTELAKDYDMVVSVGGDGTFLWASKLVGSTTTLVGVNSSPETSVGFFTRYDKENLNLLAYCAHVFAQDDWYDKPGAQHPSLKAIKRLQVKINGKVAHSRIVNDVYFGAVHPAAMTRYLLTTPDCKNEKAVTEEQKSGGVWVSSAAGSTGANLSAGGWIMPITDKRIQYVVREPMRNFLSGEEYRQTHGIFNPEKCLQKSVKIICKTRKAMIACDGTTHTIPVSVGDEIEIMHDEEDLQALL